MFGFPTKVRDLYYRGSTHATPEVISQRPLEQAVSMFAPGSQITHDGWVYTVDGFAHFNARRRTTGNPLGPSLPVDHCGICGTSRIGDVDADPACPVCGWRMARSFMYQPRGFITALQRDDRFVEGGLVPRADPPVLAWTQLKDAGHVVAGVLLRTMDQGRLVTLNDNGGRGYRVIETGGIARVQDGTPGDTGRLIAIGDLRVTDALLLNSRDWPLTGGAVAVDPAHCPAGETALFSFAEALRRVCQAHLDVAPGELVSGLHPYNHDGLRTAAIYLTDSADNGAGYALEVGNPTTMRQLLEQMPQQLAEQWTSADHIGCDSACPDCLASWDNRFSHSRLDWRLALDVADMAAGRELDLSRWMDLVEPTTSRFVTAYADALAHPLLVGEVAGLVTLSAGARSCVIGHPLWQHGEGGHNEQQAAAARALADQGKAVMWTDARALMRRPESVFALLAG